MNINDLLRSSVKRADVPSVTIKRTAIPSSILRGVTTSPLSAGPPSSSLRAAMVPQRGGIPPTTIPRTAMTPRILGSVASVRAAITPRSSVYGGSAPAIIPTAQRTGSGIGGIIPSLPAGLGIVPPSQGGTGTTRAGVVPPSTLTSRTPATAGAFGGESGGLGAAAAAAPASGATDLGIGGIGDSISSFGKGIVDTINEYIPLAIKVLLAFVVIKIVLWLLRGRR